MWRIMDSMISGSELKTNRKQFAKPAAAQYFLQLLGGAL